MGRVEATHDLTGFPASAYLKVMSHTAAANLAHMYHARGPFISSCTACSSGAQGVGFGFEAIRAGRADIMITGGAEEVDYYYAAVFDLVLATSAGYNDRPAMSPRPFDENRDGLVVAEGAGCLVLEEWDHAVSRGAEILGEIKGYWTNSNGLHLTDSDSRSQQECMRAALAMAGVRPEDVDHVNAHATATLNGDQAEAEATHSVFGPNVPVTSFKGYMGHTMGACGAIEAITTILMMQRGLIPPTLNLTRPDPKLPALNHVMGQPLKREFGLGVSNNFAFGGVNTSLVMARP